MQTSGFATQIFHFIKVEAILGMDPQGFKDFVEKLSEIQGFKDLVSELWKLGVAVKNMRTNDGLKTVFVKNQR